MNKLNQIDAHRLKWLLGQFLALIGCWAVLELDMGSQLLVLFLSVTIALCTFRPELPSYIPQLFWKSATPLMIVFVGIDFFMHGRDFMQPLVRMVLLLTLFRALQYRSRREDLQLVLLVLFILVINGVLTVSLTFALQMLIFTPLAMGLLFVVNLLEASYGQKLTGSDWKNFKWRGFLARLRASMDFRMLGFAGVLFAIMVMIG
ncbi:MAG: hypothetical protein AAGF10_06960, partial [Verrucomicrobiota bacterium]